EHGTHGATGDHAGTGRGGLQQHNRTPTARGDRVRDGRIAQRDGSHVAAGTVRRLADRVRDATRLADADSNPAIVVADDHDCAEGEAAATLHNFGDAGNVNYALIEFFAVIFTPRPRLSSSHCPLQFSACRPAKEPLPAPLPGMLRY